MRIELTTLLAVSLLGACAGPDDDWADPEELGGKTDAIGVSGQTVTTWARLTADVVRRRSLSPPQAARIYGYVGLAMYEAAQAGRDEPQSFASHLHDVPDMPVPARSRHDARIAVAVAAASTLEALVPEDATHLREALAANLETLAASRAVRDRSRSFGADIARAVVRRAEADGYEATRVQPHQLATGPSAWVSTGPVASPLEPRWGTLSPFADGDAVDDCAEAAGPPVPFSTEVTSEMYSQAFATWEAGVAPQLHHEEIAFFWSDAPGQTSTPFGHWIELAAQLADAEGLGLRTSAELFAMLGMAGADAFVTGWSLKYRYNLLRPVTYIQRHIDPTWTPRLATPPHPEYVSGHSIGSGAAAEILTVVFGDDYEFVDRTREGLRVSDASSAPRQLGSRSFVTFEDAALEAAESRLAGGIHYPMGNARGLIAGACAATRVLRALGRE